MCAHTASCGQPVAKCSHMAKPTKVSVSTEAETLTNTHLGLCHPQQLVFGCGAHLSHPLGHSLRAQRDISFRQWRGQGAAVTALTAIALGLMVAAHP